MQPRSLSAPTQSVIFIGLPPYVTEDSLRLFLEDMGASVDTTTVILDRETGQSKRFAFARFSSVEHARSFVEPNFPSVKWKDPSSRDSPEFENVRIKVSPLKRSTHRHTAT